MKIFIIGGGITGLSSAYLLRKRYPSCHITLFEKQNRLGGWIQTTHEQGYLFEKGPRTFRTGHSPRLLSYPRAQSSDSLFRPFCCYTFFVASRKTPFTHLFLPLLLPHLFREPFIAKSTQQDESIYDFISRRFSPKIATTLFDPLTLGIYGGDIRKLSIKACFPALVEWEKNKGSILLGALSSPAKTKGLFTLENGMESLIQALEKTLSLDLHLNTSATKLSEKELAANGTIWSADKVIDATPPHVSKQSLWVVTLAFKGSILPKKGYGYLIPTQENEPVLGAIFDSSIFPQRGPDTLLTIMVRSQETTPLKASLEAISRHLNISASPIYTSYYLAQEAIPQYFTNTPSTHGVSVEAALERATQLLKPIPIESFSRF